jgi:hypothetical protein
MVTWDHPCVGIIQPYKPPGGSTQHLGDVLSYINLPLLPHLAHLAAGTTLYGSQLLEKEILFFV